MMKKTATSTKSAVNLIHFSPAKCRYNKNRTPEKTSYSHVLRFFYRFYKKITCLGSIHASHESIKHNEEHH